MFGSSEILHYVASLVDILVVWYVIYRLLMAIRGTKAVQLLKGFLVIIAVKLLSNYFDMILLDFLTNELITWGFLAIIIIFQPELRRGLEELGRAKFFTKMNQGEIAATEKRIKNIVSSVSYMAKRKIGALITIEQDTGLGEYIETGIPIKAEITSQLLTNIFVPNTPLHDGGVIITRDYLAAAGCYLPLSEDQFISKDLGTRHRAAIGMSETSDSVTVVVSEETGKISVAKAGVLHHDLTTDELELMLTNSLIRLENNKPGFWKLGGKKK